MKMKKSNLAINGGSKTINLPGPHFIWPKITSFTKRAVLRQLDESISIYDNSGVIRRFEDKLKNYFNSKHCLLTSSGTAALHSMFVGVGLKAGDEVICPAYTFFATMTPIFFTGAVPILVDCNEFGNIDASKIEEKITTKTKAIVVTHMWGLPCDMDPIIEIAKKHNLLLLEDISHAFGASYKGKKVGTFGNASACSMQSQKIIAAGEGGFLLTNDSELFYRSLLLGHYNKRCKNEIPKENPLYSYHLTGMGLKLRIHPLAVAIAEEQFANLKEVLHGRNEMAKYISDGLKDLPGIEVLYIPRDFESAWYSLIIKYKPQELDGLPIEKFYSALLAEGCSEVDRPNSTCPLNLTSLFQEPGFLFPNYKGLVKYKSGDFPIAEKFYNNLLKLPVWEDRKYKNLVNKYISAFKKVIKNYKDLL